MTNFPEQLVRRVAESDPVFWHSDIAPCCKYCSEYAPRGLGIDWHAPDCDYTRSVEWVKRREALEQLAYEKNLENEQNKSPFEVWAENVGRKLMADLDAEIMDEQNTGDEPV